MTDIRKKQRKKAGCRAVYAVCLLVLCFLLQGCGKDKNIGREGGSSTENDRIRVVATIFPQYDFVRQIAGERAELKMLLKPGEESHSYEPTPQDIIAIQNCDLFIYVGGENDAWVEDILDSMPESGMQTLRLMDCVDTVEEEHVQGMQEEKGHEHGGQEEDSVHEMDEHVWTSPVNAAQIVEKITEVLSGTDPENAADYRANAAEYEKKLAQLDREFREVTEQAEKKTVIFGDRFPFRYFADEYGLEYYAAFPGCASDTEPSAETMAFLIRKAKEENVSAVLKMELSSDNIANAVAEAAGADVRVFYSCHNLSAEQFENGETYLSMMEKNVETLKEVLN